MSSNTTNPISSENQSKIIKESTENLLKELDVDFMVFINSIAGVVNIYSGKKIGGYNMFNTFGLHIKKIKYYINNGAIVDEKVINTFNNTYKKFSIKKEIYSSYKDKNFENNINSFILINKMNYEIQRSIPQILLDAYKPLSKELMLKADYIIPSKVTIKEIR